MSSSSGLRDFNCLTLNMKALYSFKVSGTMHPVTHHIPKNSVLKVLEIWALRSSNMAVHWIENNNFENKLVTLDWCDWICPLISCDYLLWQLLLLYIKSVEIWILILMDIVWYLVWESMLSGWQFMYCFTLWYINLNTSIAKTLLYFEIVS
jgi:hypothetical protein